MGYMAGGLLGGIVQSVILMDDGGTHAQFVRDIQGGINSLLVLKQRKSGGRNSSLG